ncbi:MAG: RhuM family protein [Candidatus Solibacter sp.]
MYMRDWVKKLDSFLQLNERDILQNAGRISARLSEEIACREFDKFWERQEQTEKGNPVGTLEESVRKTRLRRQKKPK